MNIGWFVTGCLAILDIAWGKYENRRQAKVRENGRTKDEAPVQAPAVSG